MGLHPAMYGTPYLISGDVMFLTGTGFIVQIFLKYSVCSIYRVLQEESAILRKSVPQVNLHRYNQADPLPKFKPYGDNDSIKI